MDFLSKVQRVKEHIAKWQKEWGDDFNYLITDFAVENERLGTVNVYINKSEHKDILKYLASIGYLKITKNGSDSPHIKILPKTKPTIRLKSLELIAIDIGELDTGYNLVDFLIECGVDKRLIVYPNTKWRMIYAVLVELACSENDRDKETLFKIIGNAVHPLMHRGSTVSAGVLESKFNNYLSYDNFELSYNKKEGAYEVTEPLSENEKKEILAELDERAKKAIESLSLPENKEKISLLRKTYQALMGVVELFCRNFLRLSQEEIIELNKHYLTLDRTAWDIIDELELGGVFENYKKYPRPFTNLFSAEKELDGDISWDVIRREMSARFGEIETLYQRVNASDILVEPNKQKQLNDVMLYLSKLKEKTKEVETDFIDTASRRGYEKKWDVLQAIWGVYESHSRPDSILVPVARLTIKGGNVQLIDGIIEGLKKEGLFRKGDRKDRWYSLEYIDHEKIMEVYQREKYLHEEKFAVAYGERKQEQGKSASPSKGELKKKINNMISNGNFGKMEKAFLKFLAKDFEPKTIEEISKEISTKTYNACKTLKARVQKKLKNTSFFIETIKPHGWSGKSQYQLRFLTLSENS